MFFGRNILPFVVPEIPEKRPLPLPESKTSKVYFRFHTYRDNLLVEQARACARHGIDGYIPVDDHGSGFTQYMIDAIELNGHKSLNFQIVFDKVTKKSFFTLADRVLSRQAKVAVGRKIGAFERVDNILKRGDTPEYLAELRLAKKQKIWPLPR